RSLDKAALPEIEKGGFLDYLAQNNKEMDKRLKSLRPLIRDINQNKHEVETKRALLKGFVDLEAFENHYILKENVLFPALESHWPDYRCLQLMWSFHDDIRRNRKHIVNELKKVELDLAKFNRLAGDLFFNMLAIKFREEKILFPVILQSIPAHEIEKMLENSRDFRYPFIQPEFQTDDSSDQLKSTGNKVGLETGLLTAKQIKLIFNHLPVDITFVDEHNKVRYFSTPAKRIFPRAKAIIGRDVKNCHPPESVHIVEEIITEFRNGNQEQASFWIKMGEVYVLIQYFAVRDKQNRYCGVVEVSQEISDIKQIEGEKRLLDWSK
ncbi:MAG: PAS domain-containing protein, partial [Bacteroidota bacterium]